MTRPREESSVSATDTSETRSVFSLQELEPSPVDDCPPDLESGDYFPDTRGADTRPSGGFEISRLGLKGHSWDYWCMHDRSLNYGVFELMT
jgi:tRNA (guanine26-N2/guanine27-N2)-dimethyltransferase